MVEETPVEVVAMAVEKQGGITRSIDFCVEHCSPSTVMSNSAIEIRMVLRIWKGFTKIHLCFSISQIKSPSRQGAPSCGCDNALCIRFVGVPCLLLILNNISKIDMSTPFNSFFGGNLSQSYCVRGIMAQTFEAVFIYFFT